MCGICGIIEHTPIAPAVLESMTDALTHRGPDDFGYYYTDVHSSPSSGWSAGLGHRRLSIIDLSPAGRQPMRNEDGSLWCTYNGEIYNFRELQRDLSDKGHRFSSRTDTEVILHGYEEYGPSFFNRINGMFAIALWDTEKEQLTLCRDRFGQKPLYYWMHSSGIAFASELKAILKHPGFSRQIDFCSLSRYLAYEYVPAPFSIFKGVYKVAPGSYLSWQGGTLSVQRYWNINFNSHMNWAGSLSEQEAETHLVTLLKKSVNRRLMSDVPLGIFLSGGIDSSSIVALLSEMVPGPSIKTFSIGFRESSFDESSYARRISCTFNTDHHEKILTPETMLDIVPEISRRLDEPFADPSIIPTFLLSQFTRQEVTVALSGDAGDELFAGYDPFLAHYWARWYEKIPRSIHERLIRPAADRLPVSSANMSFDFKLKHFLKGVYLPAGVRNQVWLGSFEPAGQRQLFTPSAQKELHGFNPYDDMISCCGTTRFRDETDELSFLYQKFYLGEGILTKTDRASMMVSLEARAPFLDVDFAEFANALPSRMKLNKTVRKYLLKKAMRNKLPRAVINRQKKGFGIPLAKWIKADLKDQLRETFNPEKIRKAGIFRPETVDRLLQEHLAGKKDNRKPIWTLFMFEKWREHFC